MLIKNIQNRLAEKFNHAKVAGSGVLSPRNGYYFIHEITFRPFKVHGEVPVALVNFKANVTDLFLEEVKFEVALSSLHSANPNLSKEINYSELIGKVISIHDSGLTTQIVNKEQKTVFNCKWAKLSVFPDLSTAQNMALDAFFNGVTTLSAAYSNFESELGIDLSESFEFEASCAVVEEVSEDSSYSADGYSEGDYLEDDNLVIESSEGEN